MVDTASGNKVTKISLVNGSQGVKDLAFSEDGKYLYTVSVISRYEYPTTQLQDGWVNTNGINVIDVAGGKPVTAVLLDDADYGAANPYGIVVKNGKLAVTLAGHDQLMVVDEAKMRAALEKVTADKRQQEDRRRGGRSHLPFGHENEDRPEGKGSPRSCAI